MNMIINNYRWYRVTDYGRGKFSLFNRDLDTVKDITQNEYDFIQKGVDEADRFFRCRQVEFGMNTTLDDVGFNPRGWDVV